jgi:hypothetical protein
MATIQIRADQCWPGVVIVQGRARHFVTDLTVTKLDTENPNESTVAITTPSGTTEHMAHEKVTVESITRVARIAGTIQDMGFPVLKVEQATCQYDAEITISREVTVQVCTGSLEMIVNRFDGEAFYHARPVINAKRLASKIRAALKDAKKHPIPAEVLN